MTSSSRDRPMPGCKLEVRKRVPVLRKQLETADSFDLARVDASSAVYDLHHRPPGPAP